MINDLIEQIDNLSVDDITKKLKNILLNTNTATKTFVKKPRKQYIKKSNKVSAEWYDKGCWMSRQNYHRTKHRHNIHKTQNTGDI